MAVLQVRDLPDDVHKTLKARAEAEGISLSQLVRRELTSVAGRPTAEEVYARIRSREPVLGGPSSADLVAEGRAERDRELGWS